MTPFYAVAVAAGLVLLVAWAVFVVIASAVETWGGLDPEVRFGATGRSVLAGLTGFGMGGLSATFAGWNGWLALAAAFGGAGVMAFVASSLGPGPERG
jgi:hypothetical protein